MEAAKRKDTRLLRHEIRRIEEHIKQMVDLIVTQRGFSDLFYGSLKINSKTFLKELNFDQEITAINIIAFIFKVILILLQSYHNCPLKIIQKIGK